MDGEDFVALMEGRHPQTGRWLRPAGAGGGRGGGIDVTFSAPKSVSVVWALADPWQREQIENAHASAVEQTVAYMRENVGVVRRRYGGEVVEEPAKDVIAAEYRHTTARGVSGASAPDPQLHSHVVITGAVREDDRIVAVASRPVFRAAGRVGRVLPLRARRGARPGGLRDRAGHRQGRPILRDRGRTRGAARGVLRPLREVARAAERFRARYGRAPERGELRNLALENRRAKQLATRSDLENAWRETASRYDFGPDEALQLLAGDRPPSTLPASGGPDRGAADRTSRRLRGARAAHGRAGADRRGADTRRGARRRAGDGP